MICCKTCTGKKTDEKRSTKVLLDMLIIPNNAVLTLKFSTVGMYLIIR